MTIKANADTVSFSLNEAGMSVDRKVNTRDWYAWNNLMPPKPDDFHVTGWVEVANPGVDPHLIYRTPQGINPDIILLDLVLVQKPGVWPQVVVWKQVRYDEIPSYRNYTLADIQNNGKSIVQVKVENISAA